MCFVYLFTLCKRFLLRLGQIQRKSKIHDRNFQDQLEVKHGLELFSTRLRVLDVFDFEGCSFHSVPFVFCILRFNQKRQKLGVGEGLNHLVMCNLGDFYLQSYYLFFLIMFRCFVVFVFFLQVSVNLETSTDARVFLKGYLYLECVVLCNLVISFVMFNNPMEDSQ